MKTNHKHFSPDRVERLSNCEIFVFGSNIEGQHMGGAARDAYKKFGAENKKFAYAYFGNFFFFGDDFYVWEQDEKYSDHHNQDVVVTVFNDECEGRGYARRVIFAGVQTEFKDCNGERIYTGDVIKVEASQHRTEYLAVGALSNEDGIGNYCFILDNHSWSLADCNRQQHRLTRVGTVFYQLNHGDFIGVNQRTMHFNGWRDTEEDRLRKVLMAKFTPNYVQELWKYQGLDILGVEYDWR